MDNQRIDPERITKPIQLLGAWLVGLLLVDASFLVAATKMDANSWQSGALTIAAIFNVPIFIGALFVLQTKFRPELQEDAYYATYLGNKTNQLIKIPKKDALVEELEEKIKRLENERSARAGSSDFATLASLSFGVNIHLQNQSEIEDLLTTAGVSVVREFGEGAAPPNPIKVAVAAGMPTNVRDEVFALAKKIGIEQYSIIEPWEEINEDVLLGSYGESAGRIIVKFA